MRLGLFILLFSISVSFCGAQCTVNAGADVQICFVGDGKFDTVQLHPIVAGTTGPTSVSWELSYKHNFGNYYTFGSMLLDDTTTLNASIVRNGGIGGWVPLVLKITDSLGNQCRDTLNLCFSKFTILLSDCIAYIKPGDSAFLFSPVEGGIPPMTYSWSTSNGDSVPTSLIVKPLRTTFYTCVAEDSIGCSLTTFCRIFVDTTHVDIDHVDENKINATVSPNPFTQTFSVLYDNPNFAYYTFYLYDVLGKQIETRNSNKFKEEFNLANSANGIYILSIEDEYKNVLFKQRLKKE